MGRGNELGVYIYSTLVDGRVDGVCDFRAVEGVVVARVVCAVVTDYGVCCVGAISSNLLRAEYGRGR